MTKRALIIGGLLCSLAVARGQTKLETVTADYYFDGPKADSRIDWANTHVFVLQRSSAPLKVHATRTMQGSVELACTVKASSADDAPRTLNLLLGLNAPVDRRIEETVDEAQARRHETAFPTTKAYLALVTKPRNRHWSQLGDATIPRLIVPIAPDLDLSLKPGKRSAMQALFRAIGATSEVDSKMLVRWAYAEWKNESEPIRQKMAPVVPDDPTLAALTRDPVDASIGAAAITEATKAEPTPKTYLTLLGGMWGNPQRFGPFFAACRDRKSKAQADLLTSLVTDPSFYELPFEEALTLARRVNPPFAGVILKFTAMRGRATNAQLRDLFLLSGGLEPRDRRRVYLMMVPSLPIELQKEYPDGFIPDYKSNGSIPHEEQLREMWAKYLGIPNVDKP